MRPLRSLVPLLAVCFGCAWAHLEWDWLYAVWAIVGGLTAYEFARTT